MTKFLVKIQGHDAYYDLSSGCLHDDPIGYVVEKDEKFVDLFGAEALLNDLEYLANEDAALILTGTHKDERLVCYTEGYE